MVDQSCSCLSGRIKTDPTHQDLWYFEGPDFADITILTCVHCGREWIRYFHEREAFTRSGYYILALLPGGRPERNLESIIAAVRQAPRRFLGGGYYGAPQEVEPDSAEDLIRNPI